MAVVLSGLLATRLGTRVRARASSEGDFAVQALRIPGTSLAQSVEMQQQLERTLKAKFPEIERVFARTGTAEIASDPMPPNISDGYMMLKPRGPSGPSRDARATSCSPRCRKKSRSCRATTTSSRSPIQLRFNELISGVRSDVAVKVFGDDMDVLNATAAEIVARAGQDRRRGRGEGRADHRPADAHREHRPREGRALRPEHAATCRTRWPPPSAGAKPARCSRATGASTSWCACPSTCARDLEAIEAACRCALPKGAGATARTLHPAGRGGDARPRRRGPTRSAARTASAGSW